MERALSPREIQTRIRAGASVEEVSNESGWSLERLEAFVTPIIAERDFMAITAQSQAVRRGNETVPHLTLGQVVRDKLHTRGIIQEEMEWDAWKIESNKWVVQVRYGDESDRHQAQFVYDTNGRFSVPDNPDASYLVGIRAPKAVPKRTRRLEAEKTVELNSELALVRVLQPVADTDDDWDGSQPEDWRPQPKVVETPQEVEGIQADFFEEAEVGDEDDLSENTGSLIGVSEGLSDAYLEGELTEVDGVYDYVQPESSIDVLYEMLSSFDEDSVSIYRGLLTDAIEKDTRPASPRKRKKQSRQAPPTADELSKETTPARTPNVGADPNIANSNPDTADSDIDIVQPSLITDAPQSAITTAAQSKAAEEVTKAAPAKQKKAKSRAKVPSWDEIVFGSPRKKNDS